MSEIISFSSGMIAMMFIATCMLTCSDSKKEYQKIESDIEVIKTVLVVKGIMPPELAVKE